MITLKDNLRVKFELPMTSMKIKTTPFWKKIDVTNDDTRDNVINSKLIFV